MNRLIWTVATVCAVLAAAPGSWARETPPAQTFGIRSEEKAFDVAPDWLRKPTPGELLAVFPVEALRKGLSGSATLGCNVSLQGALFDCKVVEEAPPGQGFGTAGVALTPQLLMKPALKNGVPVVSAVKIPITFINPDRGRFGRSSIRSLLPLTAVTTAPSYKDAAAAYPAKARAAAIEGRATLRCDIKAEGRLTGCEVVTEEPARMGFGLAAKRLTDQFRVMPTLPQGTPTRGMVFALPITFGLSMLSSEPPTGKPQLVSTPTAEEFEAVFPKVGQPGEVNLITMNCLIGSGGRLEDCRIEKETPAGRGYGEKLLTVSSKFVTSVWSAEGLPTIGSRVRVPVRYTSK